MSFNLLNQWFSTGVPQALLHIHTALFYFILIPLSMLNLMIVL